MASLFVTQISEKEIKGHFLSKRTLQSLILYLYIELCVSPSDSNMV